ncbi:MAG: prepilin-type N-terminal cleavage/methylation domain-containing protein, partial [Dehalococcoidia bacterium]
MKAFFNKWLRRLPKAESGFTLVELLVVVAIIIALAAVIIPSVASFADKGDEGAKAAEMENIQTAMDTYMADNGTTIVGTTLVTATA